MAKKTPKATIKAAHKRARKMAGATGVTNPFALGMWQAKRATRKRKRKGR